jgi:uncharacterized protein
MLEVLAWGALLRVAQTLAQAAPTIIVGLFVASIFRRMLGHDRTQTLFGGHSWRALPQAWLLGMLLPVCALGAIPIVRELRRAGISGGGVLAFALTAPLFNPLSLLYGLTLSDPWVILVFALGSLVVVTLVGLALDRLFPLAVAEPAPPPVAYGWRRIAAMGLFAAREAAGPTLLYVLIALAGVVLLSVVLPAGGLQQSMEHDNPWAPINMALVAIPAYATPMLAMSQLGMMFSHANSVGAAFVLLVLGTGVNLGVVAWTWRNYGAARGGVWLALMTLVVLGIAYAVEHPLHRADVEPAGHTHAFDIYCCPFDYGTGQAAAKGWLKAQETISPTDLGSLGLLAGLALAGGVLRRRDPEQRLEAWLETPPAAEASALARYDWHLPAPVVGGVALVGLVLFSVLGCYSYYPAPATALAELRLVNTEVISASYSGNRKHAEFFLPLAEDWTRRMQVGLYLRARRVSEYQRMKARIYLDKLELLEHALADDDLDEVREHAQDAQRAYTRMRDAFAASIPPED